MLQQCSNWSLVGGKGASGDPFQTAGAGGAAGTEGADDDHNNSSDSDKDDLADQLEDPDLLMDPDQDMMDLYDPCLVDEPVGGG